MISKIILTMALVASCITYASAQNSARFSDVRAGMCNEWAEHEAIRWANKRANDLRCREVYKDAVIVSDKWVLCTDKYRYVTGRKVHMVLYGETYDGHCGMAHFIFIQPHEGRGYFSRKLKGEQIGNFYDVVCE